MGKTINESQVSVIIPKWQYDQLKYCEERLEKLGEDFTKIQIYFSGSYMQHNIHIHTKEEAIIELSKRLQDAISQNNMLYAKLQDLKTVLWELFDCRCLY